MASAGWLLLAQLLSAGAALSAIAPLLQLHRGAARACGALRRRLLRQTEALVLVEAQRRSEELQAAVGEGVGDGTDLVHAVHRGIAAIPFGVLGAIPATRHTSRLVQRIHDATVDSVYSTIRQTTRQLSGRGRTETDDDGDR